MSLSILLPTPYLLNFQVPIVSVDGKPVAPPPPFGFVKILPTVDARVPSNKTPENEVLSFEITVTPAQVSPKLVLDPKNKLPFEAPAFFITGVEAFLPNARFVPLMFVELTSRSRSRVIAVGATSIAPLAKSQFVPSYNRAFRPLT